VFIIEVNPLPGLTPDYSDLCLIANGAKIEYRTLIGDILSGAIKRWQAKMEPGEARPATTEGRPGPAAATEKEPPQQPVVVSTASEPPAQAN
jgi:D-alanine-D-alanine ligase